MASSISYFQNGGGQVTIYECERPKTVPEEFKVGEEAEYENHLEQHQPEEYQEQNGCHEDQQEQDQRVRRKLRKFRGLSPMSGQGAPSRCAPSSSPIVSCPRVSCPALLPLSVECFIVSRGWQIDQVIIGTNVFFQIISNNL